MKTMINLFGWLGVLLIVSAYFGVTFAYLVPESLFYLMLNLLGSLLIVIETFAKRDLQPGVLNSLWALIAQAGLLRILFF